MADNNAKGKPKGKPVFEKATEAALKRKGTELVEGGYTDNDSIRSRESATLEVGDVLHFRPNNPVYKRTLPGGGEYKFEIMEVTRNGADIAVEFTPNTFSKAFYVVDETGMPTARRVSTSGEATDEWHKYDNVKAARSAFDNRDVVVTKVESFRRAGWDGAKPFFTSVLTLDFVK